MSSSIIPLFSPIRLHSTTSLPLFLADMVTQWAEITYSVVDTTLWIHFTVLALYTLLDHYGCLAQFFINLIPLFIQARNWTWVYARVAAWVLLVMRAWFFGYSLVEEGAGEEKWKGPRWMKHTSWAFVTLVSPWSAPNDVKALMELTIASWCLRPVFVG